MGFKIECERCLEEVDFNEVEIFKCEDCEEEFCIHCKKELEKCEECGGLFCGSCLNLVSDMKNESDEGKFICDNCQEDF